MLTQALLPAKKASFPVSVRSIVALFVPKLCTVAPEDSTSCRTRRQDGAAKPAYAEAHSRGFRETRRTALRLRGNTQGQTSNISAKGFREMAQTRVAHCQGRLSDIGASASKQLCGALKAQVAKVARDCQARML